MLLLAHRGDSAHRPENTLASFLRALEVGADNVELDVQLTRDGRLIVIHDATLDRTTTGQGPVASHSLEEIRSLQRRLPGAVRRPLRRREGSDPRTRPSTCCAGAPAY